MPALLAVPQSLAKTNKDAVLRGQPSFGKNYEAGLIQKFIVAQNSTQTKKQTEEKTESLNFESPDLTPKEENGSLAFGPINNLNFGGALDMRAYFPQMSGPTEEDMGFGAFDIHVAELFLTTNIGDHISILAEQLLVTSKMGDTVGQDHGFVYAIFSSIPGLPEDIAIKIGRLRNRFGIDARLDSPANPLRSPVYKTIGSITDKSLEMSGTLGPVEFSAAVLNGADTLKAPVTTTVPGVTADVAVKARNGSKPVVARLSIDPFDSFSLGVSGYTGRDYPVYSHYGLTMDDLLFNGHTDRGTLVYKNRAAIDARISLSSNIDFYAEYMMGTDRQGGKTFDVSSIYGRLNYRFVPQKWTLQLQYELFNDGRDVVFTNGSAYNDSGNFGASLTFYINDQALIRIAGLVDDRSLFRNNNDDSKAPEYLGIAQTLLSF
ncbi:MAG: hypothetical protein R3A80_11060 [Bdellovibrionota bacterium]